MQKTDKKLLAYTYFNKELPLFIYRHWNLNDWKEFFRLTDSIEENFRSYLDEREEELKQFEVITFENVEDIDSHTSADDIEDE
tara:strand:+ start:329 stop:577 length:249 start_codon:yes stop_codon:yes gene_type:complete